MPPMTRALIIANGLVFVAQMILGSGFSMMLALWPLGDGFMPWQILTYGFVHGGLSHIFFNMFGLSMFGGEIERVWGGRRFLNYYLVCVVSAGLSQLTVSALMGFVYPTVGASGGVFGVLLAYALVFPSRTIVPLFPPIPMRALTFAMIYGGLELVLGVTGTQAGVAHFAHLGGMLGGYLMLRRGSGKSRRYR